MARSRRKRCKVWVNKPYDNPELDGYQPQRIRCEGKIKPGTPFCKEHFETHKLIEVKCTGEAHSNPYIDNCMVCMPFWGRYPVAVHKDEKGTPWVKDVWE